MHISVPTFDYWLIFVVGIDFIVTRHDKEKTNPYWWNSLLSCIGATFYLGFCILDRNVCILQFAAMIILTSLGIYAKFKFPEEQKSIYWRLEAYGLLFFLWVFISGFTLALTSH